MTVLVSAANDHTMWVELLYTGEGDPNRIFFEWPDSLGFPLVTDDIGGTWILYSQYEMPVGISRFEFTRSD
jgi:hypothetical protein